MNNTYQNSTTKSNLITPEIGNSLIITDVTPQWNGIKYLFNPFNKSVILSPSTLLATKDHPSHFMMIIPAYQNFLILPTNINHPEVYKKAIARKEHQYNELILQHNQPLGTIIQIL